LLDFYPGRCPGLVCCRPFRAKKNKIRLYGKRILFTGNFGNTQIIYYIKAEIIPHFFAIIIEKFNNSANQRPHGAKAHRRQAKANRTTPTSRIPP